LCGADGAALNASQYLEQALAPKQTPQNASPEQSAALDEKNHLRALLRTYFPRRRCVTMVRPCASERDLQRIDHMPKSEMRAEFWQDASAVRSAIFGHAPAKTVANSKPISGRGLLRLCQSFVDALNSGAAPVIRDSWALLAEVQFRDALEAAQSAFCEAVERESGEGACDPRTLHRCLQSAEQRAQSTFAAEAPERSGPQYVQFAAQLAKKVQELREDALQTNARLMHESVAQCLAQRVAPRVRQCRSWDDFVERVWRPAHEETQERIGNGVDARSAWACAALPVLERAAETLVGASNSAERELEHVREELQAAQRDAALVQKYRDDLEREREHAAALEAQAAVAREEAERREHELGEKLAKASAQSTDTQHLEQSEAWCSREEEIRTEMERGIREANERAAEADWQLQKAHTRIERTTSEFTEQLDALRRETSASLEQIQAAAREELDATLQRCNALQAALDEAESASEQNREQKAALKRKYDDASAQVDQANAALQTLRAEHAASERAMNEKWRADLQASADAKLELTRALKETEARLAARDAQIATLRAELEEEKPNLEAERACAVRERIEREVERLRAELIDTRAALVERNGEIRTLENRLRDQQSEHAMAQIKLKMEYEVESARSRAQQASTAPNATRALSATQKRTKLV
jgi:hypothetical protein